MLTCGCAGIGRLASLRCLCANARTGSSPVIRTSKNHTTWCGFLFLSGVGKRSRLQPADFLCQSLRFEKETETACVQSLDTGGCLRLRNKTGMAGLEDGKKQGNVNSGHRKWGNSEKKQKIKASNREKRLTLAYWYGTINRYCGRICAVTPASFTGCSIAYLPFPCKREKRKLSTDPGVSNRNSHRFFGYFNENGV